MPGYAKPTSIINPYEVEINPTGNISSTTVQDAIEELDSEKFDISDASSIIYFQVFR